MRFRKGMPPVRSSHPNVTPLIDVVMCLIIFFMLVAKIGVATGADEDITVPVALRGFDLDELGDSVLLNVRPDSDGSLPVITTLIQGQPVRLHIVEPSTGKPELAEALRVLRFGRDATPGTADDNTALRVVIRADQNTPYRFVEPVLFAITQAGITSVDYNTRVPAPEGAP